MKYLIVKNKLLYSALFIFLLLIGLFSCQKEISFDAVPNSPSTQKVVTSITGRVLDENQVPVEGAFVSAGIFNATTDVNGSFEISNASLSKNAAFVRVEKAGYFLGSRTFVANEDANSYVEIELIPKTVSGTFDAAQGGTIEITNGGSIQFAANTVINKATNTAYTGAVAVSAYFIDPVASNFSAIMPGDLRAITSANEERVLQSFGMMVAELTGAGGEKLNLASGKAAITSFPIPSSLLAKAPASIPLWWFDETTSLWKEEGSATKQGSNYIGSVSHFSFWNCDVPYPLVTFEATIKQQNAAPLQHAKVLIKIDGDSATTSGSGYTDSLGQILGLIPANTNLQVVVYSPCGEIVYSKKVGPFSNNVNLGTINVANTTSSINFTGDVVDCNNAPLNNGLVNIVFGGRNYRTPVTNGKFSAFLEICPNLSQVLLTAVETATNQQSEPTTLPISPGNTVYQKLVVCGTSTAQYISYSLNGKNYSLTADDSLSAVKNQLNGTDIVGQALSSGSNQYIYLYFGSTTVGTFSLGYLNLTLDDKSYSLTDSSIVAVTEYGNINEFIAGSFNGTVRDSTSRYAINGAFRVRRQK